MLNLTTKTARRRIPQSRTIQWARLGGGRSLGYRRPTEAPGVWYVRVHAGGGAYRTGALGPADDLTGDDDTGLTYSAALEQARTWDPAPAAEARIPPAAAEAVEGATGVLVTVRDAAEDYLRWFAIHRKALDRTEAVVRAHILPKLGPIRLAALTTGRVRAWHEAIAASGRRLRGGRVVESTTDDARRARKASANRALTVLKAILNKAWEEGKAGDANAEEWGRVKPFRGADAARVRNLDTDELRRLLNACAPDFRELVLAAVHTGCRYGELVALRVNDYRTAAKAVLVRESKAGKPRNVYLGPEGVDLFERLTAGRRGGEPLLKRADGHPWGRNHQTRRLEEAGKVAGLEALTFHALRHSYASLYLMSGGSLISLAAQLGHTTVRMVEKHYGHLAEPWRAEEAAKHAPALGSTGRPSAGGEVVAISGRQVLGR